MPASPDSSSGAVYLRDPADFLAMVPYLLGFHPSHSLVAIMFDDEVFKGVARLDLPESSEQTPDLISACARLLAQHSLPHVLFIGYGPGWQITPIMDAVFTTIGESEVKIIDAIRCDEGRYWSYICADPSCCSPDGVPYDVMTNPAALVAVLAGYTVLPDRAAFQQGLAHDNGPWREDVRIATLAARERVAAAPADTDWFAEGIQRIRECFDHVRAGRPIPADELAWASVLLTGIPIRDIALTFYAEYGEAVSLRLWTELTRRVEPEFVPAPAVNLAFLAMRSGDGPRARVAIERALAIDPEYSFAKLISCGLRIGITPESLRQTSFADMAAQITRNAAACPDRARPMLPPLPDER